MDNLSGPVVSVYFSDSNKGWLLDWSCYEDSLRPEDDGSPTFLQGEDRGKTWRVIPRKEIVSNPVYKPGPGSPFPQWREGNIFLFFVRLKAKHHGISQQKDNMPVNGTQKSGLPAHPTPEVK